MNDLNQRERELVALGAAMGSNCIPCIEYHIPEARKAGLADSQIAEAIRIAEKVRQVPAREILNTAQRLLPDSAAAVPAGSTPAATAGAPGRSCCAWHT